CRSCLAPWVGPATTGGAYACWDRGGCGRGAAAQSPASLVPCGADWHSCGARAPCCPGTWADKAVRHPLAQGGGGYDGPGGHLRAGCTLDGEAGPAVVRHSVAVAREVAGARSEE